MVKAEEEGGAIFIHAAKHFLNLIPCEWKPVFATRRDLKYEVENKPHIETHAELGVEESMVRAFMRGPDEWDTCLPRSDKVEAFCFGADLESLRAERGRSNEPFVAWLDERSFAGAKIFSRKYRGPLTAKDLYRELKKPVRSFLWPFEISTRFRSSLL